MALLAMGEEFCFSDTLLAGDYRPAKMYGMGTRVVNRYKEQYLVSLIDLRLVYP